MEEMSDYGQVPVLFSLSLSLLFLSLLCIRCDITQINMQVRLSLLIHSQNCGAENLHGILGTHITEIPFYLFFFLFVSSSFTTH